MKSVSIQMATIRTEALGIMESSASFIPAPSVMGWIIAIIAICVAGKFSVRRLHKGSGTREQIRHVSDLEQIGERSPVQENGE